MNTLNKPLVSWSVSIVCVTCMVPAAFAGLAGRVQFVAGDVKASNPAGSVRQLQKGDAIDEGDTVSSAPAASVQIKMQDGGFIAVRPDTQLKFDTFVFNGKQDGSERSFMSLIRGGFRSVTGLVGQLNKQNYRITTPVATVGIRGTDVETIHVVAGSDLSNVAPTGTYNKVNVGSTSLTTVNGTIFINPNQMGFAGGSNQVPQTQTINTNLFTVPAAPTPKAAEQKSTASTTKPAEPIRTEAVVDSVAPNKALIAEAAPASVAPAPAAAPAPVQAATAPVQATTSGGTTINVTSGTATDASGVTTSLIQVQYGTQAQEAAAAATLAASTAASQAALVQLSTVQLVSTTAAQAAIDAATPDYTAANTNYQAVALLGQGTFNATNSQVASASSAVNTASNNVSASSSPVTANLTAASSAVTNADTTKTNAQTAAAPVLALGTLNASTAQANAQAAATLATSQTNAALAKFTANGTFADSTALPAKTALEAANTGLQSANTTLQAAVGTIGVQNSNLTAAQLATQNALTSAQTSLDAASTSLVAANAQVGPLAAAQLAAQTALATAQANLATANSNLTTATAQNTALVAAQQAALSARNSALSNLNTANSNLSAATSQNTAISNANSTASSQFTTLQAAVLAANTAATEAQAAATLAVSLQASGNLSAASEQLGIAQSKLLVVQQQKSIADSARAAIASAAAAATNANAAATSNVASVINAAQTTQTLSATVNTQVALVAPANTGLQAAATAATTAATDAGTFASTANTNAATALAALNAANSAITAANQAATTANSFSATASNQTATAQTASNNGNAALTTVTSNLSSINSNAAVVQDKAAVAAYNNPATTNPVMGVAFLPTPGNTSGVNLGNASSTLAGANTSFVLNGDGALVEARNVPFASSGFNDGTTAAASISTANVKWTGGTAADTFKLADNSIYGGRWTGATVTVTDNDSVSNQFVYSPLNSLWAVVTPPTASYVTTLTGTTNYAQAASVSPVDVLGNVGTLSSAALSVNFTAQTVDASVNFSMNQGSLAGAFNMAKSGMPLTSNGGFGTLAGTGTDGRITSVACTAGACSSTLGYSGTLGGGLAGNAASSAALFYSLWASKAPNDSTPVDNVAQGMVGFNSATAPLSSGAVNTVGSTALAYSGSSVSGANFVAVTSQVGYTDNAPTSFTENFITGNSIASTVTNAVATVAPITLTNGIRYGLWDSATLAVGAQTGTAVTKTHWITAPVTTPGYLADVLTNTNTYSLLSGNTGSVSSSASPTLGSFSSNGTNLTINFAAQTANISLNAVVNNRSWLATTPNAPLAYLGNSLTGFMADSNRAIGSAGYLTVTADGSSIGTSGSVAGQLVGTNLGNAILQFNLASSALNETVQGVAALNAESSNNANTAYRAVLTSLSETLSGVPTATVNGRFNNADNVAVNVQEQLTKFDGQDNFVEFKSGSVPQVGRIVIDGATINWGRWGTGSVVELTNRATGAVSSGTLQGDAHWIAGPSMTGPVTLPTTGTFNYVMVGATQPTDQAGNAGLLNSASLSANFSAQTVNVGVNVSMSNATFNAAAVNVPILQNSVFKSSTPSVTCTGVCGTTHTGTLAGGFVGTTGGAAGLAYGINKLGANAGTVSGVVVMQRANTNLGN